MKTYKIELEKAIAAVLSRAQDAGHLALDPEPVVYSAEQTPINHNHVSVNTANHEWGFKALDFAAAQAARRIRGCGPTRATGFDDPRLPSLSPFC